MNLIRLGSFLAALCFAQAAQAQDSFVTPASGCTPDDVTIQEDRAQVGNASVQHAGNKTGLIVLTCAVPRLVSLTDDWSLRMTYVDSTGTGTNARVRARLFRMSIGTANPVLLASLNSNASAETGLNTLESDFFTHTFNFSTNTYWLHIELDGSAGSQDVILHAVKLGQPSPSDIRLKHNIALLGHLNNGLGFYRFSYHGSDKAYVGVMAQEVEAVMPEAVVRGSDGYLRVFYHRVGFDMQTWEEWVAAGGRIPATAGPKQQ